MKKKYISPETSIYLLTTEPILIAASSTEINESTKGNFDYVKRDRSSRGSYSVWDEDWSN